MASTSTTNLLFLFFYLFTFFTATFFTQPGFAAQVALLPQNHHQHQWVSAADSSPSLEELHFQDTVVGHGWKKRTNSRRLMIGSTAPTCTYNECRGCRFRCRAEQIPVDANDPINSAYHYRCVCHR